MPSPGRGRYVLLVVVLLLAGAFAGGLLFDQFSGRSWIEAMGACRQSVNYSPDDSPTDVFAKAQQDSRCTAPFRQRRALVQFGGGVLVLSLGLGLMQWLPYRLLQRAGPMRLAPDKWQAMGDEAVRSLRGRGKPEVHFGPFSLREAFTVRLRRRTRIVLPPTVEIIPLEQAAAIVRHESAHVAAGDVGVVWLTRGVLWALPPVLVLPFVLAAAEGVLSADKTVAQMVWQPFWGEYAIRAVLLLLLTVVVSSSVLRSREHEADLRSVEGRSAHALRMLLGRSAERPSSLWGRWTALHPPLERRLAVLDRGDFIRHARVIEGVTFGLFAGMTLQAAQYLVLPMLGTTPLDPYSLLLGPLVTGTLLAFGWGTALWRFARTSPTGTPDNRAGALLGLPVGVALGLLFDFSQTGTNVAPFGQWSIMVAVPLMVAGAGALSLALAGAWVRRQGTAPTTSAWMWPLVVMANVVLFVAAVWIGQQFGVVAPTPDDWFSGYAETIRTAQFADQVVIGLVGVGMLAWRWAGRRLLLLATCVLAAAVAVTGRLLLPIAIDRPTPSQLVYLDWWVAATAGIGCLLGVLLVRGGAGLGWALATAPVATLLAAAVTLALARLTKITGLVPFKRLDGGLLVLYGAQPLFLVTVTLLFLALPAAMLPSREQELPRWVLPVSSVMFTAVLVVVVMWLGERVTV